MGKDLPHYEGADIVVAVLERIRDTRGVEDAIIVAEQIITAAASILAREMGPEHARLRLMARGRFCRTAVSPC